ncbi:hypothetical protein L7F22_023392 [Adiantum nelumboides]|nr:hypothetical protein [Adiantum nelumboides]
MVVTRSGMDTLHEGDESRTGEEVPIQSGPSYLPTFRVSPRFVSHPMEALVKSMMDMMLQQETQRLEAEARRETQQLETAVLALLSLDTILVGHSLHNDLKALKIDHPRVIDTSFLFRFRNKPECYNAGLNSLCKLDEGQLCKLYFHSIPQPVSVHDLQKLIPQEHPCLLDAISWSIAMELLLLSLKVERMPTRHLSG